MFWYVIAILGIGVVFSGLLFLRGKTSWGSTSSSLTLLRVVIGFSFFVILLDTANDLGIVALQESPTAMTVQIKTPPGARLPKGKKPPVAGRSGRGRNTSRGKPAAVRVVTDRKYELVGTLVLLAFLLYLLGRTETWGFVLDLILGVRGVDARANRMEREPPARDEPEIGEPEYGPPGGGLAPPDESTGGGH